MSTTAVRPTQGRLPRITSPVAQRVADRAAGPSVRLAHRRRLRAALLSKPTPVRTGPRTLQRLRAAGFVKHPDAPPAPTAVCPAPAALDANAPRLDATGRAVPRSSLDGDEDADDADGEPARRTYYAFALLSAERRGADVEAVVA